MIMKVAKNSFPEWEDAIVLGIFSRVPGSLRDSWVVIDENLLYKKKGVAA